MLNLDRAIVLGILMAALIASAQPASAKTYPTLNRMPPGELLLEGRAILPQGFALRPVYPKGLSVTKLAEGWVPHLYNDSAHYCTIGYGHLIKKAPCDGSEPSNFRGGITQQLGTELLMRDMATAQYAVMTTVKVELANGQYAALVDFVFNVGSANFRSSTLLKAVNAKAFDQVPIQLRRWVNAGGKRTEGLLNRRAREIALFFDGVPVPKAVPRLGEDLSPIDVQKGEGMSSTGR